MKYLFCISLILSNALHAQKTWYEAYFESTEYGKKKDRNDGPFKNYDYVWAQPNGLYVVKKKVFVKDSIPSLNSFLVDKNGKILTKRIYTDMSDFSEEMVEVTIGAENYCRGCFHTDRYSYLSLANVASGFINEKGEEVISPRYTYVEGRFKHGMCAVGDYRGMWFIDKQGKPLFGRIFHSAYEFQNGIAEINFRNREKNFIDTTGKLLIPDSYTYIEPYSYEFRGRVRAFQLKGEKIGFWTSENLPLLEPQFDEINYELLRGNIMVRKNNRLGFIDFYSAEEVIPLEYTTYIKDVKDNTILLHKDSTWYRADTSGTITRLVKSGEIAALGKGLYKFEYPDKSWGITDSLGNVWKGKQYDSISDRFKRGYLQVFQGTKTGLLDEKGEEILSPEFDKIGVSASGRILSEKEVFQYVFDQNGNHLEKSYQAGFLYKLLGATMVAGMISIGFWIYREGKSS